MVVMMGVVHPDYEYTSGLIPLTLTILLTGDNMKPLSIFQVIAIIVKLAFDKQVMEEIQYWQAFDNHELEG
jgi:hypothetical protein